VLLQPQLSVKVLVKQEMKLAVMAQVQVQQVM